MWDESKSRVILSYCSRHWTFYTRHNSTCGARCRWALSFPSKPFQLILPHPRPRCPIHSSLSSFSVVLSAQVLKPVGEVSRLSLVTELMTVEHLPIFSGLIAEFHDAYALLPEQRLPLKKCVPQPSTCSGLGDVGCLIDCSGLDRAVLQSRVPGLSCLTP